MPESQIDLIPAEEKLQRSKDKAKKAGVVVTLIMFLLVLAGSVGISFYLRSIDGELAVANQNVEDKKKRIGDRAEIEIRARNLDSKYNYLTDIFKNRLYYSILLSELSKRVPSNAHISTIDSSEPETLNLSGDSTDYVALAKLLNALASSEYASPSATANPQQNLFSSVTINTVTLDPNDSRAKFNLVITVDTERLKK
ncbi:MAG: PilN domain-containing protein [Patescibacteria group bacterium]